MLLEQINRRLEQLQRDHDTAHRPAHFEEVDTNPEGGKTMGVKLRPSVKSHLQKLVTQGHYKSQGAAAIAILEKAVGVRKI